MLFYHHTLSCVVLEWDLSGNSKNMSKKLHPKIRYNLITISFNSTYIFYHCTHYIRIFTMPSSWACCMFHYSLHPLERRKKKRKEDFYENARFKKVYKRRQKIWDKTEKRYFLWTTIKKVFLKPVRYHR